MTKTYDWNCSEVTICNEILHVLISFFWWKHFYIEWQLDDSSPFSLWSGIQTFFVILTIRWCCNINSFLSSSSRINLGKKQPWLMDGIQFKAIYSWINWFLLIHGDLVENYVAAAVVAKTPIRTALEVANFYWYIILLSPAARDTMTPRATSAIIIAIIKTLITLFVNMMLYWHVCQNEREI